MMLPPVSGLVAAAPIVWSQAGLPAIMMFWGAKPRMRVTQACIVGLYVAQESITLDSLNTS